jgi:hypothetical protein
MELENVSWTEVESSVKYKMDKGFDTNDSKCFDQFCNLKTFIATYKNKGRLHYSMKNGLSTSNLQKVLSVTLSS